MKLQRSKRVVASKTKGFRPDMVNASDVKTYRNKRNPNKYVEVKNENDGHTSARQYMEWDTPEGKVKNYNGSKSRRGRYSRMRKDSVNELLQDYDEVTSSADSRNRWNRHVATYNGQRYSVRYNTIDSSPEADPTRMLALFEGQVSEIHPYDEGSYAWARFDHGKVAYIRDGHVVDTSYYTSADDCDIENPEWCDSVIEGIMENLEYLNAYVEERIVHNSTDVQASELCKKSDLDSIQSELWNKVKEVAMSPEFGFEEKEVPMYFRVDPIFTDGRLEIEVGAEVSYDGMQTLAEALDPIVDSYCEGAYFDMEAPGLMSAWLDYKDDIENCTKVEGSTYRDHDAESELVEVTLDSDITITEDGSWDYDDESWAEDAHSYNYPSLTLADSSTIIEIVDDFIESELPETPGRYHVTGDFELYFDIDGIFDEVYDGGWDEREGMWEDFDTFADDAETNYNKHESTMKNFTCESLDKFN